MSGECPVCDTQLSSPKKHEGSRDAFEFDCPLCGVFRLSGSLEASMPGIREMDSDAGTKLSYFFRSAGSKSEPFELNTHTAAEVLKKDLPRPGEQSDLLVRWFAKNSPAPGESLFIDGAKDRSIIGARTASGLGLVIDHLKRKGLVSGINPNAIGAPFRGQYTLTLEGWEYFEGLRNFTKSYRKAFMAMKFGDESLNKILEEVFKPAAKAAGFELYKLDDSPRAGLIDDRLRVEIQTSDFILADLTHDNLGAYWEAGYAEGLGKPVIYTCEKAKFEESKTHFDTNHHLTIIWSIEDQAIAGEQLTATIRATFPELAKQRSSDV